MGNEILEVRDLVCGYEKPLLRVSLKLEKGEHLVVYGDNGKGKTTLLKTIVGLTRPLSGKVRILGEKPGRGKPIMRNVFFLPEEIVLPSELTVKEYLQMILDLYGEKTEEFRIYDALELLELHSLYNHPIKGLSQGQRRRAQLLAAYVLKRKLTLLDDPLIGVDDEGEGVIKILIEELTKAGSVLITSRGPINGLKNVSINGFTLRTAERVPSCPKEPM